MAEQLKEMFNIAFYQQLAHQFNKADKHFHPDKFVQEVIADLPQLSLNQRLRNTSVMLKKHLPDDYKKALEVMYKVIPHLKTGYTTLVFPDFVGLYGHDDFDRSMQALKYFTSFGSSEFAIREFLKRDFNRSIKVMQQWATDKDPHVRRLASEGSRPRLPWSFKLDEVIKHPDKTLPVLEILKADEELYVKKSVANHLNDISKDNTDWMLRVLKRWDDKDPNTLWIKKHASRGLIKKGNVASLSLFNFEKNTQIKIEKFKLDKPLIKLGEAVQFEFDLVSQKNKSQKLAVDFKIYYVKKNGELFPKVFKLKELELPADKKIHIIKKHLFKDFTTRKHYSGKHFIEIIINGVPAVKNSFELKID
jgi:3-methyladenine DNA glycosylase AlkC